MAIKTISLELDAYDILCRARQHPRESFSKVIRRAQWTDQQYTGATLLGFSRERIRRGSVFSDAALNAIGQSIGRPSSSARPTGVRTIDADAYVADTSYLLQLEIEIKQGIEGPAIAYLIANPSAVFRVCVITSGEFASGFTEPDQALGHQVLAQFEQANLSPVIAERYATESIRIGQLSAKAAIHPSELWVGCTAIDGNSPLLTWREERFSGITGLQTVTF